VGNKNPGAHPGVFWGLTSEYKFVSGHLCSVGFNAVRIEMSDGVKPFPVFVANEWLNKNS